MRIHLSDHFTYKKLFRFVLPTISTVIFTSIYSIADGFFVSNFVGKIPFAAVNLVFPVLLILGSIGVMIGTGGAAIVGKTLGEGFSEKADKYFSMLIYSVLALGTFFAIVGWFIFPEIIKMLGAQGELLENSVAYGRVILFALPFFIVEYTFQSFFITAEKSQLGFAVTVCGGLLNIFLDAIFIIVCGWGLFGAALATAFSQLTCAILEIIYFARKNDSLLHLTLKTRFYRKIFLKSCVNGSSEMVGDISGAVVSMLYNYQLLKYIGEDGVAAYGVIEYVSFIFAAIFFGYTMGVAPAISFHFGAKDFDELKNLFHKSLVIMGAFGLAMTFSAEIFAELLANIFVGYDAELCSLTVHAFRIGAISFLFIGFSEFGSAFFTALNNGLVSAIISFVRTFVFEIGCVMLLPVFFGVEGIWFSVIVSEVAAVLLTTKILLANRKNYNY